MSAGGDAWYSRTLRSLPIGARVNVHIPGHGYVAVGETLAEATRFDEAKVVIEDQWVSLADQGLNAPYAHVSPGQTQTDDLAEYVVPIRWLTSKPKASANWENGMFANQNSACKLRQEFPLDRLATHFAVAGDDA